MDFKGRCANGIAADAPATHCCCYCRRTELGVRLQQEIHDKIFWTSTNVHFISAGRVWSVSCNSGPIMRGVAAGRPQHSSVDTTRMNKRHSYIHTVSLLSVYECAHELAVRTTSLRIYMSPCNPHRNGSVQRPFDPRLRENDVIQDYLPPRQNAAVLSFSALRLRQYVFEVLHVQKVRRFW